MDFVCKSLITAIEALSSWYHIDVAGFGKVLHQNFYRTYISSGAYREVQFSNYLFNQLPFKAVNTDPLPRVHWFHGTRCSNLNEFDKGLLPLKLIKSTIQKRVDDIVCKHRIPRTKKSTNIGNFSAILTEKKQNNSSNNGPCAMLNYEALISPQLFSCHDYTDMPEFVEEYIHSNYGKHAEELLELYKNENKPAVVEFWSIPDDPANPQMDRIVKAFLMYTYAKIHCEDDLLGYECNTCYSGFGTPVLPERIVSKNFLI